MSAFVFPSKCSDCSTHQSIINYKYGIKIFIFYSIKTLCSNDTRADLLNSVILITVKWQWWKLIVLLKLLPFVLPCSVLSYKKANTETNLKPKLVLRYRTSLNVWESWAKSEANSWWFASKTHHYWLTAVWNSPHRKANILNSDIINNVLPVQDPVQYVAKLKALLEGGTFVLVF